MIWVDAIGKSSRAYPSLHPYNDEKVERFPKLAIAVPRSLGPSNLTVLPQSFQMLNLFSTEEANQEKEKIEFMTLVC